MSAVACVVCGSRSLGEVWGYPLCPGCTSEWNARVRVPPEHRSWPPAPTDIVATAWKRATKEALAAMYRERKRTNHATPTEAA